jgi:hypothetical protein
VDPAQIDERVAQENVGFHRAGQLDALFEGRDCVDVPVVQQQRTAETQQRER